MMAHHRKTIQWCLALLFLLILWCGGTLIIRSILGETSADELLLSQQLLSPRSEHLFGTDYLGREWLHELASAGGFSLLFSLTIALCATALGTLLCTLLFIKPLWLSHLLDGLIEIGAFFPRPLIIMLGFALWGDSTGISIGLFIFVQTLFFFRLARQRLREHWHTSEFLAAKSLGRNRRSFLFREIFPWPWAAAQITLQIPFILLLETSIHFFWHPLLTRTPTLGILLGQNRQFLHEAWWLLLFPGFLILTMSILFSILGRNILALYRLPANTDIT